MEEAFQKKPLDSIQTGIYEDIMASDYDRERLKILVGIFENKDYSEDVREFFLSAFSSLSFDMVSDHDPEDNMSVEEKYPIQWNLLVELRKS